MFRMLSRMRDGSLPLLCLAVILPGCTGQREWEVTVENKTDVPCSILVKMRADGSSTAKVDDLAPGKVVTLIGGSVETVLHSIKVTRGKDEQVVTPNEKLPVGKRFAIVIGADGKLAHSLSDR